MKTVYDITLLQQEFKIEMEKICIEPKELGYNPRIFRKRIIDCGEDLNAVIELAREYANWRNGRMVLAGYVVLTVGISH